MAADVKPQRVIWRGPADAVLVESPDAGAPSVRLAPGVVTEIPGASWAKISAQGAVKAQIAASRLEVL